MISHSRIIRIAWWLLLAAVLAAPVEAQVLVDADASLPGVQATRAVGAGGPFQAQLVVQSGGMPVAGFDIEIAFDAAVLSVREARLVGIAAGAYEIINDPHPGSLKVAAVRQAGGQPSIDAVVQITFDAIARGHTRIAIASSKVSLPNGGHLDLGTVDASIDVGQAGCTYTLSSTGVPIGRDGGTANVTVSAPGGCEWTIVNTAPWIAATPSTPAGTGIVTVNVAANPGPNPRSSILQIAGRSFEVAQSGLTASAPFGSFDTPIDNATGLVGSIAVTGWALDDVGVTRVRILRDSVAAEGLGQLVPVGDAVMVDGARPDVAATYPSLPFRTRAGWGYLLLTNFLPNQGNGTYRLHAFADDADGRSTLLGTKTITCANAGSVAPFGAIDTPGQGETVAGTLNNFGWVLVKQGARADVPGGGSVFVVVDSVPIGVPTGWTSRPDISALFGSGFAALDSTLAVLPIDTRQMADGVHTIAWGVTATNGEGAGVGSRFFTVANGAASRAPSIAPAGAASGSGLQTPPSRVLARSGYDASTTFVPHQPDGDGVVTIEMFELDRLELRLDTRDAAGQLARVALGSGTAHARPAPPGSHVDASVGSFTWQLGPGFTGTYDLVVTRRDGSEQLVRLVVKPKP